MKQFFKGNIWFLLPYLFFLIAGILLIVSDSKAEKHLEFNSFHNYFFDIFFYYFTYLGDGLVALLVSIIFLVVKFRYALLIGLSNLISALITQLLKHTLFADIVRPKKFFEGIHDLYFVPGVDNYLYNSFPSGHSTCAFALYFALSLILDNKIIKSICFTIALLVAYSRVYLSQHFFEDVYAGSLIGVVTTIIIFYLLGKINKAWMEKSLVSSYRK